ncbi:hypothetical protein SAMN06272771_3454 [Streptomyces sp. Ag82_O1-12]|uniref:hypothetical protein n=1 Tax=unclassified Streptomyces TaxID=2593676 RepID=UPI000BD036BA|nr:MULTISPECIES: hypothetical protein [unclassified Streptomyces]SMQ17072.1 hypothetical protein SAMN06272771_3454 [Streptomyces sp. Ag82_O1-12]SOD46101.1 hypothetical protein SAMN06272727_3451 [Streptomyces sp. Ag82_G6-1]
MDAEAGPAEHARFAAHLVELEQVADADEAGLVAGVLADPDRVMAGAAVVRHLDRRAAELFATPLWEEWAEAIARVMTGHAFPVRRLQEWSLLRAVVLGLPWHRDDLLGASDWLQLKAAAGRNPEALQVLAESGRTKRIRNAARTGLGRRGTG